MFAASLKFCFSFLFSRVWWMSFSDPTPSNSAVPFITAFPVILYKCLAYFCD
jgi:hypothetical protein